MIKQKSVDISCLLEIRFREKSVRIISGKSAQYKLLWIGNGKGLGGVGIFLTQKWVDKVINISRVSDRMIVNKVLVQRIIISLISDLTLYAPQYGLNNSQKDDFYGILINFFEGQGRKKFQFQQQTLMATGITQKNMTWGTEKIGELWFARGISTYGDTMS